MKKIGKYLREVSVVMLGVAITISVTIWINKKSEKKDMSLYLEKHFKEASQWKLDEIKEEGLLTQEELVRHIPMYSFHTSPWPDTLLRGCSSLLDEMTKTVSKLEKQK